jgi:hypothetical protein
MIGFRIEDSGKMVARLRLDEFSPLPTNTDFSYQYIEKSTGRTVRMGTGDFTEEMLFEDYRTVVTQN